VRSNLLSHSHSGGQRQNEKGITLQSISCNNMGDSTTKRLFSPRRGEVHEDVQEIKDF
jgi:hypothetical protein